MAKKRDILDFQPTYEPLTVDEALYHIPWLHKDQEHINFIQVIFVFPANNISNVSINDLLKIKGLATILFVVCNYLQSKIKIKIPLNDMQSSPIICPLPISPSLSLVIYMSYTPTQRVKNLPAIREAQDQFLDQEDLLKKAMATHSTILAWRIPCTEEPGRLQSVGSQRIGNG